MCFLINRDKNAVIAKMNVLFDKAAFEKSQSVKSSDSNELKEGQPAANEEGKVIRDTIFNSIQSAKLGALTVDPEFLDFRTLDRKLNDFIWAAFLSTLKQIHLIWNEIIF